ncbi:MAG: nicotinate-nucleotide adenylyltransferase [Lachnospiraceae bacterium]
MHSRTGILGGTFDPIHNGHLMLARTAYEQFSMDRILILPNGNPPHKKNRVQTEVNFRNEMAALAIQDIPYMELSVLESSSREYHYTYQTLRRLKKLYPEEELYFIIGADSLFDFPNWKHPEEITKCCTILAAVRDEAGKADMRDQISLLKQKYGGEFLIMNSPKMEVASNEIRRMIEEGEDVSCYLDKKVYDYILRYGLYKK